MIPGAIIRGTSDKKTMSKMEADGWLPMEGQKINKNKYPALYELYLKATKTDVLLYSRNKARRSIKIEIADLKRAEKRAKNDDARAFFRRGIYVLSKFKSPIYYIKATEGDKNDQ